MPNQLGQRHMPQTRVDTHGNSGITNLGVQCGEEARRPAWVDYAAEEEEEETTLSLHLGQGIPPPYQPHSVASGTCNTWQSPNFPPEQHHMIMYHCTLERGLGEGGH